MICEQDQHEVDLSVVVPCFNEEGNLLELHRRVTAACARVVGDDYEVILVDDGSTDATPRLLAEFAAKDSHLVVVTLSRNHGHQLALTAGLCLCRGRRILIIDADLQDPPELLPDMIALMNQGADVVYGQRVSRKGETWHKKAAARLFYRLLRALTDANIPSDTGDFRLMSRRALSTFLAMPEQHRFVRGMISWIGLKQVALPYQRAERRAGSSHYPLRRMLRFALDGITGFSVRPLRIASYIGTLLAVFFLVVLGYALSSWFTGAVVPGWTSVMTVVLLLGSVQMLVLGIIGEYLGRLFMEVKRRPLFLIDTVQRGAERHSVVPVMTEQIQTKKLGPVPENRPLAD